MTARSEVDLLRQRVRELMNERDLVAVLLAVQAGSVPARQAAESLGVNRGTLKDMLARWRNHGADACGAANGGDE